MADVIINRVLSKEFPNSVKAVVYEPSQFQPVSNGAINSVKVTAETIECVDRALDGEDYSNGALYFMNRRGSGLSLIHISAMGVDPVHFGIIMILNLMIGLLTPPVGMVLYVLSKVSSVPFERICKATVPFIIMFYILLQFITYIPQITLMLPTLMYGAG